MGDNNLRVDIGNLVIKGGRPVLIVPQSVKSLPLQPVFVAWKNARGARRAVADALQLLDAAGHVGVVEIISEEGLEDANIHARVFRYWMEGHGISAVPRVVCAQSGEGVHLHPELLSSKCDLLIVGAYGQSRLEEWMLGGVTEDLLLDPEFCVLLSH